MMVMASTLVGCSNGDSGSADKGNAASSTTDQSKGAEAKPAKLVVWGWESSNKALKLNMDDFKKQYPNIDVEFQDIASSDLYQKFLVTANSGDQVPDVVTLETSHMAQMVDINGLSDLTEKVKPYKDKMNQFKWADATKDGKIYAMPWDSGPVAMFYRKDIFEKAGLPTDPQEVAKKIRTAKDYMDAAKIIKEKTGAYMNSSSRSVSDNRIFESMLWQRGLWYFDDKGKVTLDSPEVIETAQYLTDMMNNGYTFDAESWKDAWLNGYKDGKVATIIGASWYVGLLQSWIAPDNKGLWAAAPMPKWSEGDKWASANDGGSNLAINKNSKNQDAAWKFIEFMLGKESSQAKYVEGAGFFPSLETTYSDPVYQKPVEYFGGQKVQSIFTETVKQVYPQAYTKDYPLANQLTTDAFAQIFLKKTPVAEAFKNAADQLRKKADRK